MKKLFITFILSLFSVFSVFADEDLFSFSAGLSTGVPIYGTSSINKKINQLDDKHRFIIGSMATININPVKQATFFTGADFLADFNWSDDDYVHFLHVAFPVGVKVYPGLEGFDLGLAYSLGFRADITKINNNKDHNIAAWSNGFKFFMEYNFAHCGTSKYYPTIGLSWNLMPRGMNDYDNLITFYILENF